MAVGSSRLTRLAKDSASPLWGVADAKMMASVLGAIVRASWLFSVDDRARLWASSMTTTSHRWCSRWARYLADFSVSIETITLGKKVKGLRLPRRSRPALGVAPGAGRHSGE